MEELGQNLPKTSLSFTPKPPVVVVLGHVDHGKTSLLDAIAKTNLVHEEFGAITQKIYSLQIEFNRKKITFVDTPGHQAFSLIRKLGADIADMALLVVAADEGVKAQTVEAALAVKAARIPFIVVITKTDLPNISLEKVKKQLADIDILVEDLGGEIVWQAVSAKTGEGISQLLELILILAELANLKTNPAASVEAVVLESYIDRARGPVSLVLVKAGQLAIGDKIAFDSVAGKVRAMIDQSGTYLKRVPPSAPVQVLGLPQPPPTGTILKQIIGEPPKPNQLMAQSPLELLAKRELIKEQFKIILKTDSYNSQNSVLANLPSEVHVILTGFGEITESDLDMAAAADAPIYGFNIKVPKDILKKAQGQNITIKTFKLIYELLEAFEKDTANFYAKKLAGKAVSTATVIATFEVQGRKIAGCKVTGGVISEGARVQLVRGGQVFGVSKIASLKKLKKKITKATAGSECGIGFETELDFAPGDIIKLVAS